MITYSARRLFKVNNIHAMSCVLQVVFDLGRKPEARFLNSQGEFLRDEEVRPSRSHDKELPPHNGIAGLSASDFYVHVYRVFCAKPYWSLLWDILCQAVGTHT